MRYTIAFSLLLATAALAQDQAPPQTSPSQQSQTQQQATPQTEQQAPTQTQQQPTTPQTQQPVPPQTQQQPTPETQQPAPPQTQQPTTPQPPSPQVSTTNLPQAVKGPTIAEIYCSGFVTKQSVHASGVIVAGNYAPEQVAYAAGGYVFLKGDDVQEGREYLLLRHMQDPNKYQSFPGQLSLLDRLGEMYQDLGRAKVLFVRKKVGVAQIESSCSDALPGDFAVPFQERPRPEFKQTNFEQFAVPNGKTTGRIVVGRDFDTFIGAHRIVYLNVGEAQGVKPGDYFRITREYTAVAENPAQSMAFYAPAYEDTQKNPGGVDFRKQVSDMPRRSVGELMVLSTTPNSATALTTLARETIELGDGVEMIDATPFPPAVVAEAAPPQPPTISCSVSRSSILVGETSNITCNGVPEEGHSLAYSYQATAGQITPRENRATLTGTAPGPVTVTATAVDDRNLSAQTTVNVDVQAAAATPVPATPTMLNELFFKPNSTYVDNRAKAILDDDALRLQRDASATVVIEGSANPSEKDALALQRAENAKTYLTRSKGIDPSRIQTRAAQTKTGAKVSVILVPAGAGPQ
jgi:outer membrane protein OmpA-like peptidoglycan-associated protein